MSSRLQRVGASALAAVGLTAVAGGLTTRDGAYTAAQAERGKQVHVEFCASCHQVDFYEMKLAAWQNATVGELFSAMSATMPSSNPGGLASGQYLDVLAYVFSITGSPAGAEELSSNNMGAVEIVAPAIEGP